MGKGRGLGRLHMGEAGHDGGDIGGGLAEQRLLQRLKPLIGTLAGGTHPEAEIGRHLVVARTRRMQAARRGSGQLGQPRFDIEVDIFEAALEYEPVFFDLGLDGGQPAQNGIEIGSFDDALNCQHLGMDARSGDILRRQALVECDGGGKLLHDLRRAAFEAAAPHLVCTHETPVTKPRLLVVAILVGAALLLLTVLYGKIGPNGKAAGALQEPPVSLAPFKKAQTGVAVPAVAFRGAGGALKSLSEYKGRVVLLNLWAPWCGPCVKELPALAALQKALPLDRFVVVPVDVGREGQAEAQAFLNTHSAGSLQTYVDSNAAVMRAFNAIGLPMTILIDKDGKEIGRAEGAPDWSAPDSVSYLRGVVER